MSKTSLILAFLIMLLLSCDEGFLTDCDKCYTDLDFSIKLNIVFRNPDRVPVNPIVTIYEGNISDSIILSRVHIADPFTYMYYTGNYITLATHQFDIPGYIGGMSGTAHYIKNRYNYRLADYHRLDLNANFHKKRLHGSRTWSIGVYNAYNQFNPYSVYPSEKYNHDTETISYRITEKSLFPIILSVSYQLNF